MPPTRSPLSNQSNGIPHADSDLAAVMPEAPAPTRQVLGSTATGFVACRVPLRRLTVQRLSSPCRRHRSPAPVGVRRFSPSLACARPLGLGKDQVGVAELVEEVA